MRRIYFVNTYFIHSSIINIAFEICYFNTINFISTSQVFVCMCVCYGCIYIYL